MMDLADAVVTVLERHLSALNKVLVCKVVDFNESDSSVNVRPVVDVRNEEGDLVEYPVIYGVDVLFPAGGDSAITWQINKGDQGVVLFNDVCLDEWRVTKSSTVTNNARRDSLSDGVYIPLVTLKDATKAYLRLISGGYGVFIRDGVTYLGNESGNHDGVVRKADLQKAIDDVQTYVNAAIASHTHTVPNGTSGNGAYVAGSPDGKTADASSEVKAT